jgi:hypothetical protein
MLSSLSAAGRHPALWPLSDPLFYHMPADEACTLSCRLLVWMLIMGPQISKSITCFAILAVGLLFAEPAAAFRCGSKLVLEGMHEQEVLAICGEPTSRHHLGYAIRSVNYHTRRYAPPGWTFSHYPGYAITAEVMVTEYIYNLGPNKLMRRLVFEGGFLASAETLGRGYR